MAEPEFPPASTQGSPSRGRFVFYAATVFLASAVLLVLEIAAARLIAPYVGVSLYTWISVIGVILAGLHDAQNLLCLGQVVHGLLVLARLVIRLARGAKLLDAGHLADA